MRLILRFLGWLFALAAIFRTGLAGFTAWLAATRESVPWDISLQSLLTEHATFLSWVTDLGRNLLPSHFIESILAKPALVMMPLGALGAALLAYVCFRFSRV